MRFLNSSTQPNTLSALFMERADEDWRSLSAEEFLAFMNPKIDQIITHDELKKRLKEKQQLSIKFGIDPTSPDVHLGHVLPIMVLRQFQKAGHRIHLIIGDFTARIGDPSGRNDQRPALSEKDIKNNLSTYLSQIGKYLNVKKVTTHKNSKWLAKLSFVDLIRDLSHINLSQVLQREDFRNRLEHGYGLSVAELLYSYAQGKDSVVLGPDVEVGGRDQLLNLSQARTMMASDGQEPEIALTTPVLEGTSGDGRKMSKSYGNYIAVGASSEEKFGLIMSIPDDLIFSYFVAFADIADKELDALRSLIASNPLELKKQLAQFIVSLEQRNIRVGEKEREAFEKKFSKKEYTEDIPVLKGNNGTTYFNFLSEHSVVSSKSELHRLFEQGSVHTLKPKEATVGEEDIINEGIIRVGKKKFYHIIIK